MTERPASLQETYLLAILSMPVLVVYAVAQASLSLVIAPAQPELKLVMEPNLLLLGLILHVQWRRVGSTFLANGLRRPVWVVASDCLSFVITFWALVTLGQAFLEEAKLL